MFNEKKRIKNIKNYVGRKLILPDSIDTIDSISDYECLEHFFRCCNQIVLPYYDAPVEFLSYLKNNIALK